MENNSQSDIQCILYKEIVKTRSRDYYHNNKQKIKGKNKIKYDTLTPEEKKKGQEYKKECFNRQSIEKQDELRKKAKRIY